jgi:hypothetical protein
MGVVYERLSFKKMLRFGYGAGINGGAGLKLDRTLGQETA